MPRVARAWSVATKAVTTPGTAVQLAQSFVPEGHHVRLVNRTTNTGNLYLGNSQTAAQTASTRTIVRPSEACVLQVMDTNLIWMDAESSSDSLEIIVEQD